MSHSPWGIIQLSVIILFLSGIVSCRKSDEKYEGIYTGIETYTLQDSGQTALTIDSSFAQIVTITYGRSKGSKRKYYTFTKQHDLQNLGETQIHRKSFENHQYSIAEVWDDADGNYRGWISSIEFKGDSLYMMASSGENGTTNTYSFSGKRD